MLRARLLEEDIVLWRCRGQALAWQDLCVHRGARLSLGRVERETLVCPYHGWTYNGEGRCVRIPAHPDQQLPARARALTYRIQERYGLLWVSLGSRSRDLPALPGWDDQSYRKISAGPYHFQATAARVIENFVDLAHLPFVHAGILGDPQKQTEVGDFEVESGPDGITATDITVWQPNPDASGQAKHVRFTQRVIRPFTAYLLKDTGGVDRHCSWMTVTPVEEVKSIAWLWVLMNYGWEIAAEKVRERQDVIFSQDILIVESQRPERLPLDLQAELHMRCDRTAIAYRKWLKQLGVSLGTA